MGHDSGTSLSDICRWSYILGRYSVLTNRLWEGRAEELEPQRYLRVARALCRVHDALRTHGQWIPFYLFVVRIFTLLHLRIIFFRNYVPMAVTRGPSLRRLTCDD